MMADDKGPVISGHDPFPKGICQKNPLRMSFAAPISFFKNISIIFGGAGLVFEGLTNNVDVVMRNSARAYQASTLKGLLPKR